MQKLGVSEPHKAGFSRLENGFSELEKSGLETLIHTRSNVFVSMLARFNASCTHVVSATISVQ